MESLGKRVTAEGSPVEGLTGGVVWGATGTDSQHAFFQYLHQGTEVVPCDLIGFMRPSHNREGAHHDMLVANLLAQAEALAVGRSSEEAAADGTPQELIPHRTMPGNRPSTLILAPELNPSVLGQLIALYEHKIFTQGWIRDFLFYGIHIFFRITNFPCIVFNSNQQFRFIKKTCIKYIFSKTPGSINTVFGLTAISVKNSCTEVKIRKGWGLN